MKWKESLPPECPPKNAKSTQDFIVYRFTSNPTASHDDFKSFAFLNPKKIYKGIPKCTTHSISVYNDLESCIKYKKLPSYRKRFKYIIEIKLTEKDGLIKQTTDNIHHYSWWLSDELNLNNLRVLDEKEYCY